MASTLPTAPDDCCFEQDNGCCNDTIIEIITTVGGSGITTHFVGDPNAGAVFPSDITIWQFGLQHVESVTGPVIAMWTWNPSLGAWA